MEKLNHQVKELPGIYKDGEEARVTFAFHNIKAQQSFSFHLTGEGKDAQVRVEEFTVKVTPG
jgi:hypothetical protein